MEENTETKQDEKQDNKTKAIVKEILSWVWTALLAFGIALFLNTFIIVNANVPTGSMQNTIQPKDRLIGNRLAYISAEPERGDIIMFKFPLDEEEIYIKRLIGLPGEHIEIQEGKVYIDHATEPLVEEYLKEEWVEANNGISYDIPEDCYFMMGDNRNNSLDGRYWASYAVHYGLVDSEKEAIKEKLCFVRRDQLIGKAMFRYYPSFTMMSHNPYENQ